jgi:hypothetical protein
MDMRKSVDDEVYGTQPPAADEVRNGNPGRPQSDYESPEVDRDEAPLEDEQPVSDARARRG